VVAKLVQKVDRARINTVEDLFRQLGFIGRELETRTRLFVSYVSFEVAILVPESRRKRLQRIDLLMEVFTRR